MKYQDYKNLQVAGQAAMQSIVDNKESYTDFIENPRKYIKEVA